MKDRRGRTLTVEREYASEDSGYTATMTWYAVAYSPIDRALCRVGLHGLARAIRADGWRGFSQTMRYECACGRRYWLRDQYGYSEGMKNR